MSVETFAPIPLTTFGSWMTLLDASDVSPGMSPDARDVEFFPGGVRTRPGLVSVYPALGGTPSINGLKTYITTNLVQRLLVLDSLGNLFKETSPGQLSIVASVISPGLFLASTTHFGREYMAFSNTALGEDMPRQYDDIYFDRVSQIGPAEGPSVADAVDAGNISPGAHQCAVIFVTRQGYWTIPSPPVTWTAAGGKKVNVTNIPTGPSNIVQRLLAFTGAGGANFYQVPATMTINDNVTTSLEVDFDDTILLAGVSMDNLFANVELPDQLGVIAYSDRLFWWGERAKMPNWRNLSFDGGWDNFCTSPSSNIYYVSYCRGFLPGKHHVARLLTPARATRRRIRLVAQPYASHHFVLHFVLDHGPNDLQRRHPGQAFDLGLQFLPHLHQP